MQIQPILNDILVNWDNQLVNPMLDDIYVNRYLFEDIINFINDFNNDLPPHNRLKLWTILTYYFGQFIIEHPIFTKFVIQLQYFQDILPQECQSQIGQLIDIVVCKSKPFHEVEINLIKLISLRPISENLKLKQAQFDRLYLLFKYSLKQINYFFEGIQLNQPYFSGRYCDLQLGMLEGLRRVYREQTQSEGFSQSSYMQDNLSFYQYFDPLPQTTDDLLKILDLFVENYVSVTSTLEKDIKQIFKKELWTNLLKQAINLKLEIERYKSVRTKPVNERSFFFQDEKMADLRGDMVEFSLARYPLSSDDKNTIRESICSFANYRGGYLFMGIDECGVVKGFQVNKLEQQMLTRDIEALKRQIHPYVKTEVDFIPVRKNDDAGAIFTCTFVCRISVFQGSPGVVCSYVEEDSQGKINEYLPKFTIRNGFSNSLLKIDQIYQYQKARSSNHEHTQLSRALPSSFSYLDEIYFMNFNHNKRDELLTFINKAIEHLQIGEINLSIQRFQNILRVFLLPNCQQILTQYLLNQRQQFVGFGCFIQWGEISQLKVELSPVSSIAEEQIKEQFNQYKFSKTNNQLRADLKTQEEYLRFYDAVVEFKNQFNQVCKEKDKFWLDPYLSNRL